MARLERRGPSPATSCGSHVLIENPSAGRYYDVVTSAASRSTGRKESGVNLDTYDGLELAELVRKGEVTPQELLEACLARIDKKNPALNAVITRMDDQARAAIEAGL